MVCAEGPAPADAFGPHCGTEMKREGPTTMAVRKKALFDIPLLCCHQPLSDSRIMTTLFMLVHVRLSSEYDKRHYGVTVCLHSTHTLLEMLRGVGAAF